jgi:hypothetical protein
MKRDAPEGEEAAALEGCAGPGGDDAHGGRLALPLCRQPPPEFAPSQEAPRQRLNEHASAMSNFYHNRLLFKNKEPFQFRFDAYSSLNFRFL